MRQGQVLRAPVNMCFEFIFLSLFRFVCQTTVSKTDDVCVCVSVGAGSPGQEYKVRKAAIKIILYVARFSRSWLLSQLVDIFHFPLFGNPMFATHSYL